MDGKGGEVGDAREPSDEVPHFVWTGEMRRGSVMRERLRTRRSVEARKGGGFMEEGAG